MRPIVKASVLLVATVSLISVFVYVTGLHRNFMLGQIVFLVCAIAVNVGIVIWALKQTSSTNGYLKQVGNSAAIGLLAGILIIAVSWLFLSVVFPDVLAESREGAITYMEQSGTPKAEVDRQMTMLDNATPMSQSIPGGFGTFFTSLLTGAVFAIWGRRK